MERISTMVADGANLRTRDSCHYMVEEANVFA